MGLQVWAWWGGADVRLSYHSVGNMSIRGPAERPQVPGDRPVSVEQIGGRLPSKGPITSKPGPPRAPVQADPSRPDPCTNKHVIVRVHRWGIKTELPQKATQDRGLTPAGALMAVSIVLIRFQRKINNYWSFFLLLFICVLTLSTLPKQRPAVLLSVSFTMFYF